MTVPAQSYQTSAVLVQKALGKLGVWSPGQSVSPEDASVINGQLDDIFRKLAALELVYVADSQNIPSEWMADLSSIVAGECATDFGASGQALVDLVNRGLGGAGNVDVLAGIAAKSLKIMMRGRPTGEAQRTESY